MTDRYRVYTKILKTMKTMVKFHHSGHVVTLAMLVAGIVLGKKAQLSVISSEIPEEVQEKSLEMRMRRWVKNEKLDVESVYMPFARQILTALSEGPLVFVMDASQVARGCMVLVVGVLYKKRALPIVWLVYPGKKGHTTATRHIEVLEKLTSLVPKNSEMILLGDAEYDTTEMLRWLEEQTRWKFVLRTSPQIYVQSGAGSHPIRKIKLSRDQVRQHLAVDFTKSDPIQVNLIGWWGQRYKRPIYLISNLTAKYLTCYFYRRRYRIETFFSDQKSRGFHIHKSHLADPERVNRLFCAACLAYIWMILQGMFVIENDLVHLIDRSDRQDKSLFRLGMDWIKYCLKKELDFEPLFWFQLHPASVHVR